MTYNLVAILLRVLDTLTQLLLTTERRFYRKDRRIATIVTLMIPTHQAQLRLINALALQLIDDIFHLLECCRHTHLRLILQSLMLHRSWHRFPALTDTDLRCGSCIGKVLILLHSLLQHLRHIVVVDEILAVATRHGAIVILTLFHRIEVDNERLICATLRQVVLVRECVVALLESIDLSTLKAQTLTNGEVGTTLGLEATHSQTEIL